ncbi:MAG: hypothetical protein ABIO05_07765 [Ferruginibacter sp.]
MNRDLNDLPDWDDNLDERIENGEEWKPNNTRAACKALYQQWSTIVTTLKGGLHADNEETAAHSSHYKLMMIGDTYEVAAKIGARKPEAFTFLEWKMPALSEKTLSQFNHLCWFL